MKEKQLPRVALIFGGVGYEKEVSVLGADNLYRLIDSEKYDKIPIFIDKSGAFLMPEGEALPSEIAVGAVRTHEVFPTLSHGVGGLGGEGRFLPIDAAFPLLHGNFGEDGVVQGALTCAKIPFVGCDTVASAASRDKMLLKCIADSLGIPTARAILTVEGEIDSAIKECKRTLGYPVFVKPTRLGSSIGAGKAENAEQLKERLALALSLDKRAIIEEYIEIEKELECAYFSARGEEIFTSPGEILAGGFYDYEQKYAASSTAVVKAAVCADAALLERLREYSGRLVRALSIRDISRIDFLLSRDGRLYFNEINTMPGFTAASLYLRLVECERITPADAVSRLLDEAIRRGA